jgi:hypothetical protein
MSEAKDIFGGITSVSKKWTAAKRKADKHGRVPRAAYGYVYSDRVTIREVAFSVMDRAYAMASSNGKYFANARQIMYAARPLILAKATAEKFNSAYFTQVLLKDYIEEWRPSWADNVVWDARGHFAEPHGGEVLGLGGAEVRKYMATWKPPTVSEVQWDVSGSPSLRGPDAKYAGVLFVEKEGFNEILHQSGLLAKFDLVLMSTKGMPVGAASDLLFGLGGRVRVFALHDFDKSGFTIVKTLRNGTRLSRGVEVVDIGLRLADIEGLQAEPVTMKGNAKTYLRRAGATPEEIAILAPTYRFGQSYGERVELNAMTSEQFLAFIERKLEASGIPKVIPNDELLREAYRVAVQRQRLRQFIEDQMQEFASTEVSHPDDLRARVEEILQEHRHLSWVGAIDEIADTTEPE